MATVELPPELDRDYYRRSNDDLSDFSDDQLASHFAQWGKIEGRAGSAPSFREYFVPLIPKAADSLEIGPYCGPQLRGDNVRYFDIATRE